VLADGANVELLALPVVAPGNLPIDLLCGPLRSNHNIGGGRRHVNDKHPCHENHNKSQLPHRSPFCNCPNFPERVVGDYMAIHTLKQW
jgi:hypothetical protein